MSRTLKFSALALALAIVTGPAIGAAGDDKAVEVLAAAKKAIGDKKLAGLKTFSLEAAVQRNIGNMQLDSDTEILLELPDKYLRSDASNRGMMAMNSATGFNGETAIKPAGASMAPGGAMVIRMGPGGPMPSQEKMTPEQEAEMNKVMLRNARTDISRLMLGWFGTAHPAINVQYSYAGEAESPDGKAHVIDVKDADGFAARLFIDQQTNLPLMVTYQAPQPRVMTQRAGPAAGTPAQARSGGGHGGEPTEEERKKLREEAEKQIAEMRSQPPTLVEHALFFDDWRSVDGVQFPHRIRRAVAGTTNEEWTVNKVRVNPKLDPKKFQG